MRIDADSAAMNTVEVGMKYGQQYGQQYKE